VVAKSIIEIDVQDKAFKNFAALFQQYQKTLQATPLIWKRVAQSQAEGNKYFKELVAAQVQAIGHAKMMEAVEKRAVALTRTRADAWRDLFRNTQGAATNIKDMTGQLMRWGALTGTISGLLGAGGLFGITRMAEGVAASRQGAQGTGTTIGASKAFATNFGRFADPDALGGSAAEAARGNPVAAFNLGVKDVKGDSSDIALRMLDGAYKLARETPREMLGFVHSARVAGSGISANQFEQLHVTSPEEFAKQKAAYGKDRADFGVGDKDARAYQDFITQMQRAGTTIETVFIKALAPLAPNIENLSKEFVSFVKELAKDGRVGKAIDQFAEGVNEATAFIKDPLGSLRRSAEKDSAAAKAAGKIDPVSDLIGWMTGSSQKTSLGQLGANTWALPVKPGAGTLDPGLAAFASVLQSKGVLKQVTAGEGDYHKGHNSAHNDGRAFDFSLNDPGSHASVKKMIEEEMAKMNIKGKVIDEYDPGQRGKYTTAPHMHVQFDAKVTNAAGADINVQTSQVAR
jgi:hypothetical protein